jgi:hypothetical protein
MSFCDDNPAGNPHQLLLLGVPANGKLQTRKYRGEIRRSCSTHAGSKQAAFVLNFAASVQMRTLLWHVPTVFRIPPLFGHRVGAFHAPCGSSLFCFGCAALRVTGSLQILFGKTARKDFSGPSVNAELRHLGAWPTPTSGAPTKIGRFHQRRHSCTRTK